MDKEQVVTTMRTVVARVLEDASFVFSDDCAVDSRPDPAGWDAVGVSLTFGGEKSGVFRVWTDRPFAALLAANMLGVDITGPDAEKKGTDALREMVNIIAGNALTGLFGEVAVFNLGIPAPADEKLKTEDCGRTDTVWLAAEDNTIVCVVDIHD
jgi:CheY-specific phosphatase CheX